MVTIRAIDSALSGSSAFMSLPQPMPTSAPSRRRRSPKRPQPKPQRRFSRQTQLRSLSWELTGRLTINLALSLVALSTLMRLIPYYQTQRQVLGQVEASVTNSKAQTDQLRADFNRYFDPAHPNQAISGAGLAESDQHIPIVWVDPLAPSADTAE